MTPNELIGLGEVCCPSCKSDNWKSSKLIVLENVSNIEGTISGEEKYRSQEFYLEILEPFSFQIDGLHLVKMST